MASHNVPKVTVRAYKDIILIVGRKEQGKSYFVKHILKGAKRFVIWDYNHEHSDLGYTTHNVQDVEQGWRRGVKKIVYQPYSRTEGDFEDFLRIVHRFTNYTLVIEEIRLFAYSKAGHKDVIPRLLRFILDTGRFRGIGLIVTSRRSHGIIVDIPYNADHIFAFKQHRPEDIDYLKSYMNPQMVDQLPRLPLYWFLHYESKTGKTFIRRKI